MEERWSLRLVEGGADRGVVRVTDFAALKVASKILAADWWILLGELLFDLKLVVSLCGDFSENFERNGLEVFILNVFQNFLWCFDGLVGGVFWVEATSKRCGL